MNFKKLALAAAVAVAPMSALALEPMQDEALSGVTGQDGISMSITTNLTTDIFIEDTDGTGITNLTNAGFMAIQNVNVTGTINLDIDSASTAGTDGTGGALVIGVSIPTLTLANLSVGVTGSSAVTATDVRDATEGFTRVTAAEGGTITNVMSLGSVTLSGLNMGVQLGPDAQNFLTLDGSISAIDVADFSIIDASISDGGALFADQLYVSGLDLTGTTASINDGSGTPAAGLNLTMGPALADTDVALMGLGLGDTAGAERLGNVYLTGLNLSGTTINIAGK